VAGSSAAIGYRQPTIDFDPCILWAIDRSLHTRAGVDTGPGNRRYEGVSTDDE
jgi:hypothetical protein